MSVEGLHASFEKIDGKIRGLVQKGATNAELGACIRRSWAHHFQRPVSEAAIKGLVAHYRAMYTSVKKTRKSQNQKGGMAPLDYQVGPGSSAVPYGVFPSEMGRVALSALDNERFFESPVGRHCNTTGGEAAPQYGGGNRRSRSRKASQRGGSLWDSLTNGHAMGSVPRNVLETGVSVAQGAPIMNPNPDPVHQTWTMAQNPLTPYDTTSIHQYQTLAPTYTGYNN